MAPLPIDPQTLADLDRVMHEPARLCLAACLYVTDQTDFVFLQSQTRMTGGNLSSHIRKLEETGYAKINKEFNGAKPRTLVALTAEGRTAFERYLATLRRLVDAFA